MKLSLWAEKILWAMVPAVLALLIGVQPQPVELTAQLRASGQALEAGKSDKALPVLVKITQQLPWYTGLFEITGQAALKAGEPGQAILYLHRAWQAGQISGQGLAALGQAYTLTGDLPAALVVYQAALGHPDLANPAAPLRADIYRKQLHIYQETGNLEGQISVLRALTELDPGDQESRYILGMLIALDDPQAALSALLGALKLDDSLESTIRVLEKSLAAGQAAPPLVEDQALQLMNAGRALALVGQWELASLAFLNVTRIVPDYADGWAYLGEANYHLPQTKPLPGRIDPWEAIQAALALDPESLSANLFAGLYWKRLGDNDPANAQQALEYYLAAEKLDPGNPAIQVEIASTYALLGNTTQALDHYQKAIQLAPGETVYWHLLAQYSLENQIQVEQIGLAAARQALFLNANDPVALDLIGYGYYLLGDRLLARRFFDRALAADATYPPVYLHLALLAFEQGNHRQARIWLDQVFALAPGSPAALQAEQIREQLFP